MIPSLLTLVALSSTAPAADTTRWIVTTDGRPAGDLGVVRSPDSVKTRFIYTDRNRGGRIENRYRLGSDGRSVVNHVQSERFEVVGDSAIVGATRVRREAGAWIGLKGDTPWEQTALARYLLDRPNRTAPVLRGTAGAAVVADTVLRTGAKRPAGSAGHGLPGYRDHSERRVAR